MSISFSPKYLTELKNPNRTPNIFIEIDLGWPVTKWGQHKILPDVHPVLKGVSKSYNRLDMKKNITTKGDLTFRVIASAFIDNIIVNNRLKNLRVKKYEGFIASGWDDSDYIKTFEGVIYNWRRTGETYTFKARDVRQLTQTVAPVAETDKTQFID